MRYLRALRRHWKLIAAMSVIAVLSAAYFSVSAQKQYQTSADLLITPLAASDDTFQGFSLFRQTFEDSSSVVTASRIFGSRQYSRPAFEALGSDGDGATVSVRPLGQANIVTIEATAPKPGQAARVANRYTNYLIAARSQLFQSELQARIGLLRKRVEAFPASERAGNFEYAALQQQLADFKARLGTADPTVQLLAEASVPGAPSWPRPKLSIAMALLASLLLGGGIALVLELASPRVTSEEDLRLEHRLPILTRIPRIPQRTMRQYLLGRASLPGSAWKGYRVLRAVLATVGPDGDEPRSILVTSASPGDAKTATSVNLAITLAASGQRVILMDGDLHRPMIATVFNVAGHRDGISRLFAGRAPIESAIVQAPTHPRLKLLLASPEEYGRLGLRADRFQEIIKELQSHADIIVVDSAPIPEVAEVLEMAAAVDAVVVCVRLGHTRRDKLSELREMFGRRGIVPAGFVVTTREKARRETEYAYPTDDPTRHVSGFPEASAEEESAPARPRLVRSRNPSEPLDPG